MPKKKSVKLAAQRFQEEADEIQSFATTLSASSSKRHATWIHNHAIIRLYRAFEHLMLQALIGAINNDTTTISTKTGINFPKHLTDEVCEYLIVGDGYFDFRGRSGLIREFKRYVPDTHYLVQIVRTPAYKDPIDQMVALRNFAAHASGTSKARALKAVRQQRMSSAGAWLKLQDRFGRLCTRLQALAREIEREAPY